MQMSCESCARAVKGALEKQPGELTKSFVCGCTLHHFGLKNSVCRVSKCGRSECVLSVFAGVQSVQVDLAQEEVLVETSLSTREVQGVIESTGRRAVLKGIGGSEPGAALASNSTNTSSF